VNSGIAAWAGLLSLSAPCAGAHGADISVTGVLDTTKTASDQPIVLPRSNVQVVVTTVEIPKGAKLPEHMHPFARYGYLLAGNLSVTNDDTGRTQTFKAGDFIVEAIGQWHHAANAGDGPVKLLVIDQVEAGRANTILRK
jgi:quercetin dioxygenase-like cupin family protein